MRSYFRRVRALQFMSILSLFLSVILLMGGVLSAYLWYQGLPEDSPVRARWQLGKFLTRFEVRHIFYDWRNLGIPIYDLMIKPGAIKTLLKELPPPGSLMTDEYNTYVKADFAFNNKKYDKVKVRLRGLSPNHWIDEKKSWRVKFDSDEMFDRKKSINLIIPQDRGFFIEYLSNHIARKMGLWVPDDNFAFLRVNGVLQGIYYGIEQPTGKFLELHRKVDTANFYRENNWNWLKYGFDRIFTDIGHWKKYTSESVDTLDDYSELDYLLKLLNNAPDEKFYSQLPYLVDMDNFAAWQAHSMVMGSYHQSEHGNMNLYCNIINGKFEFMAYDLNIFPFTQTFIDKDYNPLVSRILAKGEYLHKRNIALWDYVKDGANIRDDLAYYDNAYARYRKGFYADRKKGFTNVFFDKEVRRLRAMFLSNIEKIRSNLDFAYLFATVRLFPSDQSVTAVIDNVSGGFSAVEIDAISAYYDKDGIPGIPGGLTVYYDSDASGTYTPADVLAARLSNDQANSCFRSSAPVGFILYPGRDKDLQPVKRSYRFFVVADEPGSLQFPLRIEYKARNAVTGNAVQLRAHTVNERSLRDFSRITMSHGDFLNAAPMIKNDPGNAASVTLPSGEYAIRENIIIPSGVNLTIEPGAVLRFGKGVSFISYGRVSAAGTAQSPIVFTAINREEPWGNFAIVGSPTGGSVFSHVIAEYAGESYINGIYFTGAVCIHSSKAKIESCIFRYNTGDDTVNTKTGESTIVNCVFYKNFSDGADFDFSPGVVMNNYIKDNGGDGIDLCRSDVYIEGNVIEGAGDKGISIGEQSNPVIVNNLIREGNIGFASKDMSHPVVINNVIVDNNVGIEAYQKKGVFGPAAGEVFNTIIWGNKIAVKFDAASSVSIGNSIVQGGFEGKNVFETAPVFKDPGRGDYLLSEGDPANTALRTAGDAGPLRRTEKYRSVTECPVGLLSNPDVPEL